MEPDEAGGEGDLQDISEQVEDIPVGAPVI